MTVVPNFVVGHPAAARVTSVVRDVADRFREFSVDLGPRAMFGPQRDVPVLLAHHPSFRALHGSLAETVASLPGFKADVAEFWAAGYRPHATIVPHEGSASDHGRLDIRYLAVASLEGAQVLCLGTHPLLDHRRERRHGPSS